MKSIPEHKSKWPIRPIANMFCTLAVPHIVKAFDLQDQGKEMSFRFKYHTKMWYFLNKPYAKWGTVYRVEFPLDFSQELLENGGNE